jgi:DNA ligase (NAD+)
VGVGVGEGCAIDIVKNKVKLPYEMWSMDKIKAESDAVEKWAKKYKGPYVISAKLDGISALYVAGMGGEGKLYTRGNGKVGQDISYMIPYLKLPTEFGEEMVIRGELIISKDKFKKYAGRFANARNFVAGLANQKKIEPSVLADIDFVAYELIRPVMKPSDQMKRMKEMKEMGTIEIVKYEVLETISNEILSGILIDWRESYKYEIDGIICMDDKIYARTGGNPAHAFAFKMVLSDQVAEAKVIDVIWNPSKDGYLKPRVRIEPVELDGVVINFATGKNARFIKNSGIGLGAVISIIRSGDVIPEIKSVISPAPEVLFPKVDYVWNDTGVDIMLTDLGADKEMERLVKGKNIAGFFKLLEVGGLGPGIISKLIDAGYDSVPAILAMSEGDFLKVEGFGGILAAKIYGNIRDAIAGASLSRIAAASNIFGRGFGEKKMQMIFDAVPVDILLGEGVEKAELVKRLNAISGMARKSSENFIEGIDGFLKFLKDSGLENKLQMGTEVGVEVGTEVGVEVGTSTPTHVLHSKKIIMTGSKDKLLLALLKKLGADIQSSMTKDTEIVLVKDKDEDTAKAKMGRKLGILMSVDEFKKKYGL